MMKRMSQSTRDKYKALEYLIMKRMIEFTHRYTRVGQYTQNCRVALLIKKITYEKIYNAFGQTSQVIEQDPVNLGPLLRVWWIQVRLKM